MSICSKKTAGNSEAPMEFIEWGEHLSVFFKRLVNKPYFGKRYEI
jgi:hypothetical protein